MGSYGGKRFLKKHIIIMVLLVSDDDLEMFLEKITELGLEIKR